MADRSVEVRLRADIADFQRKFAAASASADSLSARLGAADAGVTRFGNNADRAGNQIDRLSGRIRLFADAAVTLGPALVPIGAVAIPAVTGLAAALGFAATGAATAVVAFQGVGDALEAVRKARLEPTVENLQAARQAMEQIAPPAREFVTELMEMGPAFKAVRDAAAAGLFPGLVDSLGHAEDVLPRVASLFEAVGDAVGDLAADGAESFAGPRWAGFIAFMEDEAPRAITELGHTLGDLTHGLAELWMAFTPLNRDFSGWLRDVAASFDGWASGLAQTEGFREFVEYVRTSGPQVAEAMGAIGNALLQIVQAAAPLGGPVLGAITGIANALARLADSDLGTPIFATVAALTALSRVTKLLNSSTVVNLTSNLAALARTAGLLVALEGAGRAMDFFEDKASGAAPSVERLTAALRSASQTRFTEAFGSDLQDALGVLDSGGWDGFIDDLNGIADSSNIAGGFLHSLGATVLPGLGSQMSASGIQTEKAAKAFASLDSALTSIAGSGGIDAARKAFSGLADSQGLTYDQQQKLLQVLPGYASALASSGEGAGIASDGLRALLDVNGSAAAGIRDTSGALEGAADAAMSFSDALAVLNGWLDKQTAQRNYAESIRALSEALRDGFQPKDMDAILTVGRTISQVASLIKDKSIRADFLQGAIKSLEGFAGKGPKAAAAIQPLLNQLKKLDDTTVEPKIDPDDKPLRKKVDHARGELKGLGGIETVPTADLGIAPFLKALGATKADLRRLDRDKATPGVQLDDNASGPINSIRSNLQSLDGFVARVGIHTVRTYSGDGRSTAGGPQIATGGHVTGPGTGTSDDIPAWLSNGEFVVKAAAVDHYGVDTLHRLNAMMLADGGLATHASAPGYANGGPASRGPDTRRARNEVDRFTDSLEKARNAIEREREQRDRLTDRMKAIRNQAGSSVATADLFGNGLAGLQLGLEANANDTKAKLRALRRADRKGLSGGLEKLLQNEGDLLTVQQVSELSRRGIRALERDFGVSHRRQERLGDFAANEQLGKTLRGLDQRIERMTKVIDRLDGKVERGVERGAEKGTRKGNDDRARGAAQRARAGR